MYDKIESCATNNEQSVFFKCERGLHQRDHLSPLLFSNLELYLSARGDTGTNINFVSNEVNALFKILVLLYADDTVIFAKDKTEVQKGLDDFYEYCELCKLDVNTDKIK